MALEIWAQAGTEIVSGDGLADGTNVVLLPLDREQHGASNGSRFDGLALISENAQRQGVVLEDQLHRLKIELGRQIEHCKVLVIERLRHLRLFVFTVRKILEQLTM